MADGEVVPLHAVPDEPETFAASDIHFEVAIDDEPQPGPAAPVDPVPVPGEFRPAIPVQWRTSKGRRIELERHWRLLRHRAAVHGLRSPLYLVQALAWAVVGLLRLIGRQVHWWWVLEQHQLRSQAAADGDSREWMKLH